MSSTNKLLLLPCYIRIRQPWRLLYQSARSAALNLFYLEQVVF